MNLRTKYRGIKCKRGDHDECMDAVCDCTCHDKDKPDPDTDVTLARNIYEDV